LAELHSTQRRRGAGVKQLDVLLLRIEVHTIPYTSGNTRLAISIVELSVPARKGHTDVPAVTVLCSDTAWTAET